MCGINFILDKSGGLPADLIGKMNNSIKHRGMDNTGTHIFRCTNGIIYSGANRLRIIDHDPASDQPMISPDGKKVIVFSGEIYNHKDLRKKLEIKGIHFRTISDTETLLYYLAENGPPGLAGLQGMFAFVYFDLDKNFILAGRDRHGMKPLFISENSNALIFSSETRGIISTGIINREFSATAINDYLKYRYIRQPKTIYKNIFQLSPGYFVSYDLNNKNLSNACYIKSLPAEPAAKEDELITLVERKLCASLESHLESEKTAGLMLSGGVDSTLLLAIARKNGFKLPYSFSVVNHEDEKSFGTLDYRYIGMLKEKFGLENHYEILADKNILHEFPQLVAELDMPVGDPAFISTSLLSRYAAAQVGVLLSGAGADEYLGGYNRHTAYEKYLRYRSFMLMAKSLNPLLNRILYSGAAHPYRKKFRLIKKLLNDINRDPMITYDNFMSDIRSLSKAEITGMDQPEREEKSITELLNLAFKRDRAEYLVDDVLMMSDQITLHNGVEIRSPYLDNSLTDYITTIDPVLLLKYGSKWILKELLKKYNLSFIASRPKEGFGMPIGSWIREKEFYYLRNNLLDNKNLLFEFTDFTQVCKLVNRHFKYREDHSNTVFSLLVLSEWLKAN